MTKTVLYASEIWYREKLCWDEKILSSQTLSVDSSAFGAWYENKNSILV